MTTPTADPLHTFHAPRDLWNAAKTKAANRDEAMSEVIRALLTGWTDGGVMLTRPEAARALEWGQYIERGGADWHDSDEALTQRLEAATEDAA